MCADTNLCASSQSALDAPISSQQNHTAPVEPRVRCTAVGDNPLSRNPLRAIQPFPDARTIAAQRQERRGQQERRQTETEQ